MTRITKALLAVSVVALAACSTSADRFGAGGPGSSFDQGPLGSVSDPTSVAYFQETVGDRVLFEVDQSTLTAGAEVVLSQQATWLMTNAEYSAIIEGHADERGTREYNLALGARRASAVQDYLVSRGVAPNRLRIRSFGKERPVEICSDESCYSQNRRAVTVLSAGPVS